MSGVITYTNVPGTRAVNPGTSHTWSVPFRVLFLPSTCEPEINGAFLFFIQDIRWLHLSVITTQYEFNPMLDHLFYMRLCKI